MTLRIHQEGCNEKRERISVGKDVKEWNLYAVLGGLKNDTDCSEK
jgi:hypothetical protein